MLTLYSQEQATKMMLATERKEALAEGRAEGEAIGEARGAVKGVVKMLKRYMKLNQCDVETAMDEFEIEPEEREAVRKLLS